MMDIGNKNWQNLSDSVIIESLGAFIKHHRLEQNITQSDLADKANINRSTLSEFERGTRVNMITFIQLLRAMDLLHTLEAFTVQKQVSPLELAKKNEDRRQRASKSQDQVEEPSVDW
ncbi:MAG TPA: transcriptional regulator [Balneola sp.]|jgi:transcriptional regulator with XRE-family HTH domain|nr:transcriptional regulator [Bacteroidota bacterium]MAC06488.1 transcriptional regulator [Balneola sp.]MAO78681.1 transcriptional regulator [Balneola sp.]MBF63090.1 transcriptional regulator [Balneola sp.]HAH49882.1 transcriptional regulator [Balneola sp.]|tara:strand:+ start:3793 stop:4143 length:351 start_codon:yes stop_codon:yes gene_type:complete